MSQIDIVNMASANKVPQSTLSAAQRDVLVAVHRVGPAKGLDVRDDLGDAVSSNAVVYTALDALVDRGLVEKAEIDGRTNSYRVSDRGRELIRARIDWEDC
jgi:DNA-binding PadR family transcriptional regulator